MTILMSGVNMFAMAKVMQVVLGWKFISASGFRPYGGNLCGVRRLVLRDFNEVLQFFSFGLARC